MYYLKTFYKSSGMNIHVHIRALGRKKYIKNLRLKAVKILLNFPDLFDHHRIRVYDDDQIDRKRLVIF